MLVTANYELPFKPILNALKIVSKGCYKSFRDSRLKGIHLQIQHNVLRIESSDGRRIVRYQQQFEGADCDLVFNRGIVTQIAKAEAETLRIELKESEATFIVGDCTASTLIEDSGYPDTDKAIASAMPDGDPIRVNRRALKAAIDQVGSKADSLILMEADPVDCVLRLSGSNDEAVIPVDVSQWSAAYLDRTKLDLVGRLSSRNVMLCVGHSVKDNPRMTTIEPLGGDSFLIAVMGVTSSGRPLPEPKVVSAKRISDTKKKQSQTQPVLP